MAVEEAPFVVAEVAADMAVWLDVRGRKWNTECLGKLLKQLEAH